MATPRPSGGGRTLFTAAAAACLALLLLLVAVARTTGEDLQADPWWEQPSLAPLLLAPYVLAAWAVYVRQRDRAVGGLLLVAAGLSSLGPAVLTATLLILPLVFLVLAAAFVGIGLSDTLRASARPPLAAAVAAIGIVAAIFAAPAARFAEENERCVRVTRYASGREVREVFQAEHTNGLTAIPMSPPAEGVRSERAVCTTNYTTIAEALGSTGLVAASLAAGFALPAVRRGRAWFSIAATVSAALAIAGLATTAWAVPGVLLLILSGLVAFAITPVRAAPSERN